MITECFLKNRRGVDLTAAERQALEAAVIEVRPVEARTTLIRAGALGLPDSFQEREDIVDVILQFPLQRWTNMPLTLQIGAENILDDDVIQTQGDFVVSQYTRGVTFGMSITYSPPAP